MSKTYNKKLLVLCALLLLSMLQNTLVHAASRQDIQQLRTLSYSVIDNVLVYHNPLGTPFGSGNAEAHARDMQRLLQLSVLLALPEVTAQAKQLDAAIADLRHLPHSASDTRSSLPPYSLWIPQVIEQQSLLSALLSDLYERQPASSDVQQELHGLSQDIQRLSLSYQLEAFPHLVSQLWMLDKQTVVDLDASVGKRFAELSARDTELAAALEKLPGRYQFVRSYLLNPVAPWAPSAVERYLLNTARELDNIAARLTH